jgi:hypothetical protein
MAKDTHELSPDVDDILGHQEDQGVHFASDRNSEFGYIVHFVGIFNSATMDVHTILPLQLVIAMGIYLLHERRVDNAGIQGIEEVQEPDTSANGRIFEATDSRRAWLVGRDFAIRPLEDLSIGNGPIVAREGGKSLYNIEPVSQNQMR